MEKVEIKREEWDLILKYISNHQKEFESKSKIYLFLSKFKDKIIQFGKDIAFEGVNYSKNNIQKISNSKDINMLIFEKKTFDILNMKINKLFTYKVLSTFFSIDSQLKDSDASLKNILMKYFGMVSFVIFIFGGIVFFLLKSYIGDGLYKQVESTSKGIYMIDLDKSYMVVYHNLYIYIFLAFFLLTGYIIYRYRKMFVYFNDKKILESADIRFKNYTILFLSEKITGYTLDNYTIKHIRLKVFFENIFGFLSKYISIFDYQNLIVFLSHGKVVKTKNNFLNSTAYTLIKGLRIAQLKNIKDKNKIFENLLNNLRFDTEDYLRYSRKYVQKIESEYKFVLLLVSVSAQGFLTLSIMKFVNTLM